MICNSTTYFTNSDIVHSRKSYCLSVYAHHYPNTKWHKQWVFVQGQSNSMGFPIEAKPDMSHLQHEVFINLETVEIPTISKCQTVDGHWFATLQCLHCSLRVFAVNRISYVFQPYPVHTVHCPANSANAICCWHTSMKIDAKQPQCTESSAKNPTSISWIFEIAIWCYM